MATAPARTTDPLRAVQIAILAKAPLPGLAKTRLIPALGAAGAARLQRLFTRRALQTALAAQLGPVSLWCTPDVHHRSFRALAALHPVTLQTQPAGDLGQRMHHAFEALCPQGPLLLIGTDCPALTPAHLRAAAQAVVGGQDAVVQPAEDGGYVLIGLRQPQPALFEAMTWSTDQVMQHTRQRALAQQLSLFEAPTLWDVDLPSDLPRWWVLQDKETPCDDPKT
jgi:uncharacterized protein